MMKKILLLCFLFQCSAPFLGKGIAQEEIRKKFYVGLEMGAGALQFSKNNISGEEEIRYALGFYGGYCPLWWLRIGLNVNGWLIESYGNFYHDPSKGVSISNTYGQLELFPFEKVNFFTNFQCGRSSYINMHPDGYHATGTGFKVGLGYEHRISSHGWISFIANYGFGNFKNVNNFAITVNGQNYQVVEVLLGFTYN